MIVVVTNKMGELLFFTPLMGIHNASSHTAAAERYGMLT